MNEALKQWLALAPDPPPLPQGKEWHAFLSYRSTNRRWVLQLYDILTHLGYKVFLDQYALSAAATLAITLGEALDRSATGILIWSSVFEESEWCKDEYAKMLQLENSKNGFRFVVAKIDSQPVAGFASTKVYADFAESREGPTGSNLLRLLYGLQGKALPNEAVGLAAAVDEEAKETLSAIAAARANGDVDELKKLADRRTLLWLTSPIPGCRTADALISLKQIDLALNVLDVVQADFPKTLRCNQLRGLALRRKGDWQAAQKVLGKLYQEGEIDPETLGIYAATWMGRYQATGNRLFLLKSRDLYRQAFEAWPKDYYTGINAASKSLLLGEKETAAQLAKRVEEVVGTKQVPNDYWQTATVGEVQLLQSNYEKSAELYQAAVVIAPEALGDHESTWGQAKLLMDALEAPTAARNAIGQVFGHLK